MSIQPDDGVFIVFEYIAVILLGLILGSFTTAISYRVPRGISWAFGTKTGADKKHYRSACPNCETVLQAVDLIPLFSWLFMRGKCRFCKESIPYRYPLIEFGVVFSVLLSHQAFGLSSEFIFMLFALPFLWSLLVIDLEYMILPNQLVAILVIIGGIRLGYYSLFDSGDEMLSFSNHLLGLLVYPFFIWFLGWVMTKILKKEALGFGDVKFFAAAGLWLGVFNLAAFSMIAGVFGIVFALLWRFIKGEDVFPFGPALIVSFFVILLLEKSDILRFLEI